MVRVRRWSQRGSRSAGGDVQKAAPEIEFEFELEDIITVSVRLYRAGIGNASAAAPHISAVIRERAESILSKGGVV